MKLLNISSQRQQNKNRLQFFRRHIATLCLYIDREKSALVLRIQVSSCLFKGSSSTGLLNAKTI